MIEEKTNTNEKNPITKSTNKKILINIGIAILVILCFAG